MTVPVCCVFVDAFFVCFCVVAMHVSAVGMCFSVCGTICTCVPVPVYVFKTVFVYILAIQCVAIFGVFVH